MMNKKVGQNVAWNTFGSVFYYFCQWLTTILVVRIGSYELSGYYSLAMTTSASFSAIASFSMRNYQISDINNEFSDQEYIGSRILTCLFAQFLCMLVTLFTVSSSMQWLYITLFMLLRIGEAFIDVIQGIEQKRDRYGWIGVSFIIRGIIFVVFFALGLYTTKNLSLTLGLIVILNFLVIIFYDLLKIKQITNIRPVFNKAVRRLLIICVPIVVFSFLLNMESTVVKTIFEYLYGAEELGFYSSIASPTMIVQVGASVVFAPFLPGITKLFFSDQENSFKKAFRIVVLTLIVMSLFVTVGAMIVGKWGLTLLFGSEILSHYDLFMPIVWVTILTAYTWILSSIVIAIRNMKSLVIGMIVDFAICIGLSYPMISKWGGNGVSYTMIISLGLYSLYMIILVERQIFKRVRPKFVRSDSIH